jgi:hypothetical protein
MSPTMTRIALGRVPEPRRSCAAHTLKSIALSWYAKTFKATNPKPCEVRYPDKRLTYHRLVVLIIVTIRITGSQL